MNVPLTHLLVSAICLSGEESLLLRSQVPCVLIENFLAFEAVVHSILAGYHPHM
jgi:hypothetical protein